MCEHKTCGQNEQNLTLSDKSSTIVRWLFSTSVPKIILEQVCTHGVSP